MFIRPFVSPYKTFKDFPEYLKTIWRGNKKSDYRATSVLHAKHLKHSRRGSSGHCSFSFCLFTWFVLCFDPNCSHSEQRLHVCHENLLLFLTQNSVWDEVRCIKCLLRKQNQLYHSISFSLKHSDCSDRLNSWSVCTVCVPPVRAGNVQRPHLEPANGEIGFFLGRMFNTLCRNLQLNPTFAKRKNPNHSCGLKGGETGGCLPSWQRLRQRFTPGEKHEIGFYDRRQNHLADENEFSLDTPWSNVRSGSENRAVKKTKRAKYWF